MGRVGALGLVAGVLIVLALWQGGARNVASVLAMQRLIGGNATVLDRFLGLPAHPIDGSPRALTTAALLEIDRGSAEQTAQAENWLRQALAVGDRDDQQTIGIRLEQQAERWAARGDGERARATFAQLRWLTLPFPEPYFRSGDFAYATLFDVGVPYTEAFELAIVAPGESRRDNAYRAMAHIRLCERALVGLGDARTAIEHCQAAIDLDADQALMTWFTPLAEQLLHAARACLAHAAEAGCLAEQ